MKTESPYKLNIGNEYAWLLVNVACASLREERQQPTPEAIVTKIKQIADAFEITLDEERLLYCVGQYAS